MCGILGGINYNNKEYFTKALDLLHHRGPDGFGIWDEDNHALLGHKRLSILDLSELAHQPMRFGDYVITYNGEIFNFIEIKEELLKNNVHFISNSDTEVILKAYILWGAEALNKFNGMWAFGIYNTKTKNLFLSRDRYGIKPLYYYHNGDLLLFSSEVKPFYQLLGSKAEINSEVTNAILNGSFSYHGTVNSYLKNIYQVPPGHNLTFENNQIKIQNWYTLNKIDVPKNFEESALYLKELLTSACNLRLRSDVPVATCLSGGLDSSSIAAILSKSKGFLSNRFKDNFNYEAFCASFPGSSIDESEKASRMAKSVGLNLNIIEIEAPNKNQIESYLNKYDGPSQTLAFYPIMKLYEKIKEQGFTVSIDGQGPDEMLGGYNIAKQALKGAKENFSLSQFIDAYKTYAAQGESTGYSSKRVTKDAAHDVLWKDFARKILNRQNNNITEEDFYNNKTLSKNSFEITLFKQFFQNPLPGILQQYDRCSMTSSVECRMPFMDYRIVEFIFSLPSEYKIGNGYTKYILREAMKGIVPNEIRNDKVKLGFNAPIMEWFKGDLNELLSDTYNSKSFYENQYFDGKKYKRSFDEFSKKENPTWNEAWKLWAPFHINWWEEHSNSFVK